MLSIYWVLSRDCNQHCGHCYNDSMPGAPGLTLEQATACVDNLPDPDDVFLNSVALSGGEPLVFPELTFHALKLVKDRFKQSGTFLAVQTNGDLMDGQFLDRFLDMGVGRISVTSMDKFHLPQSIERRPYLTELFASRGFEEIQWTDSGPTAPKDPSKPTVAFWGATEDLWIGPLWPRGRGEKNGLSKATHETNFCGHGSGAKDFLNYRGPGRASVSLQLSDVYPCCVMTCRPVGDLQHEPLSAMLDRYQHHPVFRALNDGVPERMGESYGLSEAYGADRSKALGNHCLWCDEFFTKHAPELLHAGARTERGTVDLTIRGRRQARKLAAAGA